MTVDPLIQKTSLGDLLAKTNFGKSLMQSAGPVAEAYVNARDPVMLLNGPRGSAKTTTDFRKILREAIRSKPNPETGIRRYAPGIFRPKYKNLWGTTIPSWLKHFPVEAFPDWTGASGRDANHIINFQDAFGPIELHMKFRAFAEGAEEEDMRGSEFSDAMLDEMDTHDEAIITNIAGSLARDPPRFIMQRNGRIFGSCNAPDVTTWVYRDFWESPKPGYKLYRQPGGLDAGAENAAIQGPDYYRQMIQINGHRPWYVRKMVHNLPGFTRDMDVIVKDFDDSTMVSKEPLKVYSELPVIIGFDGGNTPAAVFMQMPLDGQLRVLAEVALPRGDEGDLAEACKVIMAQPRFRGCEFIGVCDPAMAAGEDDKDGISVMHGSMRQRLAKAMGIKIIKCITNDPETRHGYLRGFAKNNKPGRPGILLDPSIKVIRRGLNQTFHYRKTHGTDDRGGVVKNPDSHACEALEYGCSLSGEAAAHKRKSDLQQERLQRRMEKKPQQRYNPLSRRSA
jgi:hypothetical protein